MKLLKSAGCLLPADGGNVKEQTMIVEEQGIDFRTGVRFPSGPLFLVVRRAPRSGRMPYHQADANERSSYNNASAPLFVVRRDPRSGRILKGIAKSSNQMIE